MKFLDRFKIREFLEKRHLTSGETNSNKQSFTVPADTGRKTALARLLASYMGNYSDCLLVISEWEIWPSSENMELFRLVRLGLGNGEDISNFPGHFFERGEIQPFECILDIVLYFYWDAEIFLSDGSLTCRVLHDEIVEVIASGSIHSSFIGKIKSF